jgi:hypothetical protein
MYQCIGPKAATYCVLSIFAWMLLLHLIATVTIHIIILPQNLLYCSIVTGFDHIQQSPFCLFLFADLKMESSLRSHFLLFSSSSSLSHLLAICIMLCALHSKMRLCMIMKKKTLGIFHGSKLSPAVLKTHARSQGRRLRYSKWVSRYWHDRIPIA